MNINAIKTLTGAGKYCSVLTAPDGKQWITEGHAAWLVEDVKIESAATIASLFNLSEKQIEKSKIVVNDTTSKIFDGADALNQEPLEELGMIYSEGVLYIGLKSEKGAIWINADFLKPVREDYRQYFVRWHEGDDPTIAVYDDLMTCKAIILPITPDGADGVRMEAARMSTPSERWEKKKAEAVAVADEEEETEGAPVQTDMFDGEVEQ